MTPRWARQEKEKSKTSFLKKRSKKLMLSLAALKD
jgi:hypothetical protein